MKPPGAGVKRRRKGGEEEQQGVLKSGEEGLAPKDLAALPTAEEHRRYFSAYEGIQHQKTMLEDATRMEAYHTAVSGNAINFEGKVVLDVGCGTGVLSVFAAKAGAKKVYAVEASKAAELAKELVAANGLEGTIEVVMGLVEKVELPEKVDIIISEFMGHFLLRESMLDCVLLARDKYLKPEGAMYPSSARMFLAPITSDLFEDTLRKYEADMKDWDNAKETYLKTFGIDMSVASEAHEEYLENCHLRTSKEFLATPEVLLGDAVCIKEIDLLTATLDDVKGVNHNFSLAISNGGRDRPFNSFLGWFDFSFEGSPHNPSLVEVACSTGPSLNEWTHWGQEAFVVDQPVALENGDKIEGTITMARAEDNWRMYDVTIEHTCCHFNTTASGQEVRRDPTSKIRYRLE